MSEACESAAAPRGIDAQLAQMRADWEAFARYTVYRAEGIGSAKQRRPLHTGKTWSEAQALRASEEATLASEPGYRPDVMCRPIICIELEDAEATTARYRARHAHHDPMGSSL